MACKDQVAYSKCNRVKFGAKLRVVAIHTLVMLLICSVDMSK